MGKQVQNIHTDSSP